MVSERGEGEEESVRLKGVGRGEGTGGGGGLISNPMPNQCILCGEQFNNHEELENHEKKDHPSEIDSEI